MKRIHVHIIKTGGTIEFVDPAYQDINQLIMKLDPTIDSYLKNIIKPHFTYSIEAVLQKDSRSILIEDLDKLARVILDSPHENILVTHGTFTMKETAIFLDKKQINKKIILTGSMIPIFGFAISDAPFNLGFAMASFEHIDIGVYLSVNGGVFKYDEVEKNLELLRFE